MLEASEPEAEALAAVPVALSDMLVAVIVIEPEPVAIMLVEASVVVVPAVPAAVPVLVPVDEAVAEAVDAQVADVGKLSTPSPPQRF